MEEFSTLGACLPFTVAQWKAAHAAGLALGFVAGIVVALFLRWWVNR